MQDPAERTLLQPHEHEVHDISPGTLRFISVLFAAGLVLMVAGVI
jgi:hypothetical protein